MPKHAEKPPVAGFLYILAEDGAGRLHNLEVQRKETIDHARRTRFYAAMIDSEYLLKGQEYSEMPEVHILYLSETDLWDGKRTVYEVIKHFRDTMITYDDGVHVTYVNAEIDDGSAVAGLMRYFKTADPEDMSQGELSERVRFLKCEEGGYKIMEDGLEKLYDMGRTEGKREGKLEGEMTAKKETAINLARMGMSADNIAGAIQIGLEIVQQWISGVAAVGS